MKHTSYYLYLMFDCVTPCVGVWIETLTVSMISTRKWVTPCVGVWIETPQCTERPSESPSHPAWVCGLKPTTYEPDVDDKGSHPAWVCGLKPRPASGRRRNATRVTPCVGVWIETRRTLASTCRRLSHPAWVCGLKPPPGSIILRAHWSHPAWVCGLKLANLRTATKGTLSSHPAWVCGLKHHYALHCFKRNMSHPAWVCGLKLFHLHRWIIL